VLCRERAHLQSREPRELIAARCVVLPGRPSVVMVPGFALASAMKCAVLHREQPGNTTAAVLRDVENGTMSLRGSNARA